MLGSLGCAGGVAAADQIVVSATIYPFHRSATSRSVALSTLERCTPYAGPNPMAIYPGGGGYQAPGSAWSLSTVLSCGLGQPLKDVTNVQVLSTSRGFEAPLSAGDLSLPSPFQDPQAQPLISNNGGQTQNTYFRPWRGGTDQNATDLVTAGGPITIVVFENGSPLQVSVSQRTVSTTATAVNKQLGAAVHDANGSVISPSPLTWSWSFGDGMTSTAPRPTHAFGSPGVYPVTVQVTDHSTGQGGTATVEVKAGAAARHGTNPRTGAGNNTKSKSANGPGKSAGTHPGGRAGNSTSQATPRASSAPPTKARIGSGSHPTAPIKPRVAPAGPLAPLVTGRLISDVTALPPGANPLAHQRPVSAPAVRSAISPSVLPALSAGVAVLLLFGVGAGLELHGRRHQWAPRVGG